jgi:hypothetical protein
MNEMAGVKNNPLEKATSEYFEGLSVEASAQEKLLRELLSESASRADFANTSRDDLFWR